ncbi:MAG TPA: hypothetical protein DCX06_04375, partial [Opitutae bacterium]|nr:hypothetical protein [Opitutae bacterium]
MIIQKLLLPLLIASSAFAADMKPNVVLIYADDMGYGEVEALNPERSKVPTPSLNALAAEGMILLIGICF